MQRVVCSAPVQADLVGQGRVQKISEDSRPLVERLSPVAQVPSELLDDRVPGRHRGEQFRMIGDRLAPEVDGPQDRALSVQVPETEIHVRGRQGGAHPGGDEPVGLKRDLHQDRIGDHPGMRVLAEEPGIFRNIILGDHAGRLLEIESLSPGLQDATDQLQIPVRGARRLPVFVHREVGPETLGNRPGGELLQMRLGEQRALVSVIRIRLCSSSFRNRLSGLRDAPILLDHRDSEILEIHNDLVAQQDVHVRDRIGPRIGSDLL